MIWYQSWCLEPRDDSSKWDVGDENPNRGAAEANSTARQCSQITPYRRIVWANRRPMLRLSQESGNPNLTQALCWCRRLFRLECTSPTFRWVIRPMYFDVLISCWNTIDENVFLSAHFNRDAAWDGIQDAEAGVFLWKEFQIFWTRLGRQVHALASTSMRE